MCTSTDQSTFVGYRSEDRQASFVDIMCARTTVLFWGDRDELQACPKCKEFTWEDVDGSRRVPHKVLRHFPLIPRLQRIFDAQGIAADAEWHETKREKNTDEMSHLADGEACMAALS